MLAIHSRETLVEESVSAKLPLRKTGQSSAASCALLLHADWTWCSLEGAEYRNPEDSGLELTDRVDALRLPGTEGISLCFPTRKH